MSEKLRSIALVAANEGRRIARSQGWKWTLVWVVTLALFGSGDLRQVVSVRLGGPDRPEVGALATIHATIWGISMISFVLGIAYGANAFAFERRGYALAVLARPISRTRFVLGKWLGLVGSLLAFEMVGSLAVGFYAAITGTQLGALEVVSLLDAGIDTIVITTIALALGLRLSPLASFSILAGLGLAGDAALLATGSEARAGFFADLSEYLLPASLPSAFFGAPGIPLDPASGIWLAVRLENLMYAGFVLAFAIALFERRDLALRR